VLRSGIVLADCAKGGKYLVKLNEIALAVPVTVRGDKEPVYAVINLKCEENIAVDELVAQEADISRL
jgi:hypothetical protein